MKVFFVATPRGLKSYSDNYRKIASLIEKLGYIHTCRFLLDFDKSFYQLPREKWKTHHQAVLEALYQADVCVFEITVSSMTIGQLLQQAIILGKPVIALHTSEYESIFLGGAQDIEQRLQVLEYSSDTLKQVFKDALDYAQDWLETRFTMILTSPIKAHLDKIAKSGVSRSDYIRKLIEQDMKK